MAQQLLRIRPFGDSHVMCPAQEVRESKTDQIIAIYPHNAIIEACDSAVGVNITHTHAHTQV